MDLWLSAVLKISSEREKEKNKEKGKRVRESGKKEDELYEREREK